MQGARLQLVRATPQQAQQHKEEERQARLQAIHDAAGHSSCRVIPPHCFSHLFATMQDMASHCSWVVGM